MDLKTFQAKAVTFLPKLPAGMGDEAQRTLTFLAMCLAGESGEFVEKVKKLYRDADCKLDVERRRGMVLELGDVLWTLSALADWLHTDLEQVADLCMAKYEGRRQRGTLGGSGDDR